MPQENKILPQDPDALEMAPRTVHENLHGSIPPMATETQIRTALEKAFDYRGDVTITLKDGTRVEGYVFDRRGGPTLAQCCVRLLVPGRTDTLCISYGDIAALDFSGRDAAAGKSWETWLKKYHQKKAAGESNIGIQAESLD